MNVKNEMLNSPWTMRPTNLERSLGRLLRSPEGHPDPDPAPADPNPSLVTDPDPNKPADPADPNKPADPADPNKPADPKPEPEPAPEPLTIDKLTLPENFEIPEAVGTELLEILNGDQPPLDRANALIALHAKTLAEAQEADSKAWENMQTEWRNEVKADTEIGGDKLQPTLNSVGKLVSEFGNDEVKKVFDVTGAGNNVHMIKFLNKIANVLTEGNYFTSGAPGVDKSPEAAAKRMFPSMKG